MADLVEITKIYELTGFTDLRSVKKWCALKKIPLFQVGKRIYTIATFLEMYIESELEMFVKENYLNPSEVLAAVKDGDKEKLLKSVKPEQLAEEVKTKFTKNKNKMGKTARNLLEKLKSA